MKMKSLLLLMGIATVMEPALFAQEAPNKVDVFLEYSYLRFNPTIPHANNRSFNGGGGEVTFNISSAFGIKAEFLGYGSTTWSTTLTSPLVTRRGIVPAGTYSTQANMFTYLFGPVVRFPRSRISPFGEILFGGSNSNGYANFTRAVNLVGGTLNASTSGAQHPFTMAVGGGLDFKVSRHLSIRPVEIDYVMTRYTNPVTSTNNQNNFRYLAGLGFRF
jgi:opacity protein-like surface antigen